MPDKPFLKTYKIDFINISRTTKSSNSTSGQIGGGSAGAAGASAGNSSSTVTTSDTKNDLMESLVKNVTDIILEEDRLKYKSQKETQSANKVVAQGDGAATSYAGTSSSGKAKTSGGESGPAGGTSGAGNETVQASGTTKSTTAEFEKSVSVFANKETGVLIARATSRQHEKIQEFIDRVMMTAKRQVMIEATIVEVRLSDRYRQGIDWSRIKLGAQGFTLSQAGTTSFGTTAGALAINYLNPASKYGNILASIELLEEFGNVKVLSSPKMSVMNNQTASLKVADNLVYFNVFATTQPCSPSPCIPITAYTTTPVTVAVGFTMNVTPHISDNEMVTINVRPSISRSITDVLDPNPSLLIANKIPVIQTREMESIIKVESGQTAVMGGLIQEEINKKSGEVPFLARIPILGNLFQNRDDTTIKTELVIFLRPVVINDASIQGDFKEFSKNLPNANFFHEDARGNPTEH
jgi:MSHA biogenesis protein MshL